jgi:DNA-binding LacI/PurR family transcriptional regulator
MTTHLIETGRTRIAAIGRETVKGTASVRLKGYRTALTEASLPYDPRLVIGVKEYSRAAGKAAMRRLLRRNDPPDAVFCFNDLMAIGALRACAEANVAVPDDIAIAGFDNIPETEYVTPTLTTVDADLDILSREALRLLLTRIAGSIDPVESVRIPWQLRIRESTRTTKR